MNKATLFRDILEQHLGWGSSVHTWTGEGSVPSFLGTVAKAHRIIPDQRQSVALALELAWPVWVSAEPPWERIKDTYHDVHMFFIVPEGEGRSIGTCLLAETDTPLAENQAVKLQVQIMQWMQAPSFALRPFLQAAESEAPHVSD